MTHFQTLAEPCVFSSARASFREVLERHFLDIAWRSYLGLIREYNRLPREGWNIDARSRSSNWGCELLPSRMPTAVRINGIACFVRDLEYSIAVLRVVGVGGPVLMTNAVARVCGACGLVKIMFAPTAIWYKQMYVVSCAFLCTASIRCL